MEKLLWWVKSCYKLIFSLQKWCCGSKGAFLCFFFSEPRWFEIFFWNGYPTEREKGRVLRDSWFGIPPPTKPNQQWISSPGWPGFPAEFLVKRMNSLWLKTQWNQWYLFFETNDNNKHSLVYCNFFEINESSIVKSTMRTENPDEINDNSCEECYYTIPAGPATST